MLEAVAEEPVVIRALMGDDFAAVAAIDAEIEGRSRTAYVERRLKAALAAPHLHAQFAAIDSGGLVGYVLARVLEGEFGRVESAVRLEMIGVRPEARGRGAGTRLFTALAEWARRHGVRTVRTAASWNDFRMLRWLDAQAFRLAPNVVVECAVDDCAYLPERDDAINVAAASGEIDFGLHEHNDFERSARHAAQVTTMAEGDLEAITRIDATLTGGRREAYIRAKLAEAMDDAAIRLSLAARLDGVVVGYLMARADFGDFGRTEPVAIIDTIGVDPAYAGRGVGQSLLSQLFANLGALRVERVETVVAHRDIDLLGFLYGAGFVPSQRLPLVRDLA